MDRFCYLRSFTHSDTPALKECAKLKRRPIVGAPAETIGKGRVRQRPGLATNSNALYNQSQWAAPGNLN